MNPRYYLYIFLFSVVAFQFFSKIAVESFENQDRYGRAVGNWENPIYQVVTSLALISVFIGANSLMSLALKVEKHNNVEKEI